MNRFVALCVVSALLGVGTSEAVAQGGAGQGWSMLTGRTVGNNENFLHVQAGWPGVSATLLHGMTPTLDFGGIFSFNYGLEGDVSRSTDAGIKLQGLARIMLSDTGRFNLGLNFAPGILLYFANSRTLFGIILPAAFVFGIPVSPAVNISLGADIPFWFYVTQGGGAVIPILFGGGVEYFVDHNMAITFNLRMGPTIYTSTGQQYCIGGFCYGGGSATDFDLQALIGLAVRL